MAGRGAGRELPAVRAAARRPGRAAHRRPRPLRRRVPVRRLPGVGPRAAAVADDRARRPHLERRLGAGLPRHLPRPADRLLLHGQPARDPDRRAHRRGRRQQRRRVGRPVAVAGAADRLRLVGRGRHPPGLDPVPGRRRRHLGHQLRPQPAPVARAHLLGGAGRLLGAALDGRHPRRARPAAAVAPPPGHPLRAVARPGTRVADRRRRAGRALRRDPAPVGVRHRQSRLRHRRGRPGARQPDALRGLADGEAAVLPRGRRAVRAGHPHVLLAAHRRHRGRRQAARQAGAVGHARAGGAGRAAPRRQPRRLHGGPGAARQSGRGRTSGSSSRTARSTA